MMEKVRLASACTECSPHSFLNVEEFNPGPIFQCNSLSIQDLQKRKTEQHRRPVERIAVHLRGKQMVSLKAVIDVINSNLQKNTFNQNGSPTRTLPTSVSVINMMLWLSQQSSQL